MILTGKGKNLFTNGVSLGITSMVFCRLSHFALFRLFFFSSFSFFFLLSYRPFACLISFSWGSVNVLFVLKRERMEVLNKQMW